MTKKERYKSLKMKKLCQESLVYQGTEIPLLKLLRDFCKSFKKQLLFNIGAL